MNVFGWNWDPWGEMRRLKRDVEQAFGAYAGALSLRASGPPVNVYHGDDGLTLTAELPGVRAEDFSVETEGEVLRISGKRSAPGGVAEDQYHRRERELGAFTRELRLPAGLDLAKISAKLAEGILTVHLPKLEQAKPRKIEVTAGS